MLQTDNVARYAKHHEGYFIGQPMTGGGTFGEWALARALVREKRFILIEYVRAMTGDELSQMLAQPIMYWFVLVRPKLRPLEGSWALMQCQYNPCAARERVIYTTHFDSNHTSKVAV